MPPVRPRDAASLLRGKHKPTFTPNHPFEYQFSANGGRRKFAATRFVRRYEVSLRYAVTPLTAAAERLGRKLTKFLRQAAQR